MSPEAETLFKMLANQQREDLARLAEPPEAHHLDSRPIYLPVADKKTIDDELSRLNKPQWRGRPHE